MSLSQCQMCRHRRLDSCALNPDYYQAFVTISEQLHSEAQCLVLTFMAPCGHWIYAEDLNLQQASVTMSLRAWKCLSELSIPLPEAELLSPLLGVAKKLISAQHHQSSASLISDSTSQSLLVAESANPEDGQQLQPCPPLLPTSRSRESLSAMAGPNIYDALTPILPLEAASNEVALNTRLRDFDESVDTSHKMVVEDSLETFFSTLSSDGSYTAPLNQSQVLKFSSIQDSEVAVNKSIASDEVFLEEEILSQSISPTSSDLAIAPTLDRGHYSLSGYRGSGRRNNQEKGFYTL